jgi:hypothetical protein
MTAAGQPLPTQLYFGESWDVPALDGARRVPTPVGEPCIHCETPVAEGDRGFIRAAVTEVDRELVAKPAPAHVECELAGVMGHVVGVCSCTGYGNDLAAARLVWQRVEELSRRAGQADGGR